MKTFKEIEAEFYMPKPVYAEYGWVAYLNGEVFGPFSSRGEAKEKSSNVERICVNFEEWKRYQDSMANLQNQAYEVWLSCLRAEFPELNDKTFSICYAEAYDRGHSAGYDEVACVMQSVVEFAKEIMAANSTPG